jgi:hypothetical protein
MASSDPDGGAVPRAPVLTFKPLKAAPAAELSIASLNLQGPTGRVIAFEPLVGFKTAIAP